MLFFYEKIAKIKQSLMSIYIMCLIEVKINKFYQKFMMTHFFLGKICEFGGLDLAAFLEKIDFGAKFCDSGLIFLPNFQNQVISVKIL